MLILAHMGATLPPPCRLLGGHVLALQLKNMDHLFCLFVGQMEAQIPIGEIDPSFGRILAAHRDFCPEESGEIDKVLAYFYEGGFHTLLLLLRAHESAPPPDTHPHLPQGQEPCHQTSSGTADVFPWVWHAQVPCMGREALCRTKNRGHGGRLRRRAQRPKTGERRKRSSLNLAWLRGMAGVVYSFWCHAFSCLLHHKPTVSLDVISLV